MLPMDAPRVALDMISRFVTTKPFSAGLSRIAVVPSAAQVDSADCGTQLQQMNGRGKRTLTKALTARQQQNQFSMNMRSNSSETAAAVALDIIQAIPLNGAVLLRLRSPLSQTMKSSRADSIVGALIIRSDSLSQPIVVAKVSPRNISDVIVHNLEDGKSYAFVVSWVHSGWVGSSGHSKGNYPSNLQQATVSPSATIVPGCFSVTFTQCCGKGLCSVDATINSARCRCDTGYSGEHCEFKATTGDSHGNVSEANTCPQLSLGNYAHESLIRTKSISKQAFAQLLDGSAALAKAGSGEGVQEEDSSPICPKSESYLQQQEKCTVALLMSFGSTVIPPWIRRGAGGATASEHTDLLQDVLLRDLRAALAIDSVEMPQFGAHSLMLFASVENSHLDYLSQPIAGDGVGEKDVVAREGLRATINLSGSRDEVLKAISSLQSQMRDVRSALRRGLLTSLSDPVIRVVAVTSRGGKLLSKNIPSVENAPLLDTSVITEIFGLAAAKSNSLYAVRLVFAMIAALILGFILHTCWRLQLRLGTKSVARSTRTPHTSTIKNHHRIK